MSLQCVLGHPLAVVCRSLGLVPLYPVLTSVDLKMMFLLLFIIILW